MATVIQMPKLGNTVEECLLTAWRRHKGDFVVAGDVVAEIETDKTSFEITAPSDGTLLETFFEEGDLVPVFTNLCVIGSAGESVDEFRPQSGSPAGGGEPRPDSGRMAESTRASAPDSERSLSPRARRFAREHNLAPWSLGGSGPGGRVLEADLRMAGGDVAKGVGSGIGGVIPPRDVVPPAARISSVREVIARRLRDSLSSTAQYTLHGSANAGGLLAVRKKLQGSAATADVHLNDVVVFCAIRALQDVPDLNAEFIDGSLYRYAEVHMGFACDTERGLVVPVVRDSQSLSLLGLSLRMKELAVQAVQGTIAVDDLNGGTFTVSNLGGLGVEAFTPILNPPQVAILGVNQIQLKPVRKKDGNVEFIDSIGLSLTLDHQVIDGGPGARFLNVLREKIENAEALCSI